jgi:glyoxylase-like metal-dependent hydrolase (beta-lactamase superfamily II)
MPLQGLNIADLMEDDYSITDDLTTIATPGHTPGHISIVIVSNGERGFILGDVAHSPAQAHQTDWNAGFDMDGETARKTRHATFDKLETDGSLVASGHYPAPGFGRFVRDAGRRVWQGV